MDHRVFFTGVAVLVVIIWYLAGQIKQLRARPSPQSVSKPVFFSDPTTCAQILACKGYDNTGAKNLFPNVKSRAIPNRRLIQAFDIDNSFTTSEGERRREFNLEAGKAIKMTEAKVSTTELNVVSSPEKLVCARPEHRDNLFSFNFLGNTWYLTVPKGCADIDIMKWQQVAVFAEELVGQAILPSNPATVSQSASVTLDSLVRSVCLKIVLHVLFNKNQLELDNESIATITESINTLWIQSKGDDKPSKADKSTLRKALANFSLDMDSFNKRENSLNLIIPSYETLWRVVLAGFLQVTFVRGASPKWRSALEHFLANPTIAARKEFVQDSKDFPVSVDHLVKETLRLYPSVKRVYRQLNMDNGPGPEDVAANIEACQRNKEVWGADAQCFVPSRWITASNEAQNSYMAFGVSPFVCPAKGEFGPMIIGILMAAFTHHLSSEKWHLNSGEGSLDIVQHGLDKALSGEEPLVSDRSTYEGIRIVRK